MDFRIEMSSPEHHPRSGMPKALRDLFYGQGRDGILSLIRSNGCPHNGGQHTLTIWGERADVTAWLDLFGEQFPEAGKEVAILKANIRKEFVHHSNNAGIHVVSLAKITQQHPYKGELISRPWFWTEAWEEEND